MIIPSVIKLRALLNTPVPVSFTAATCTLYVVEGVRFEIVVSVTLPPETDCVLLPYCTMWPVTSPFCSIHGICCHLTVMLVAVTADPLT